MSKSTLVIALLSLGALTACQSPSQAGRGGNSEFNCIAGTVGGAIIGGLIGSTIGGGRGNTLATAAGIGAGGYLGNQAGCR